MFNFTKQEFEEIKGKLMLNEEMSKILEMKIKGYSIVQISMKLNISESTASRRINKLKKKLLTIK